jgi:ABC-type transport system involved in multi-copper enzyme maturation permease subunit
MLRPLLHQEMLLGGRRSRPYLLRWILAAWLVIQVTGYLGATTSLRWVTSNSQWGKPAIFADSARSYVELFVWQLFIILTLVTPALAAGAISDEKSRGTLQYLLTADLLPWEIVVGKLLGRTYQVLLLALTGLPLACFFGVFAGLDLLGLAALAASVLLFVFFLASASVLASVVCRHTRDAVLGLYAVLLLGGIALAALRSWLENMTATPSSGSQPVLPVVAALAAFLNALNPFAVWSPGWIYAGGSAQLRHVVFPLLAWAGVGGLCLLLASWRLRPAYLRQLQGWPKKPRRWWHARRAAVSDRPVRWKERHVEGIAPLALLRGLPRWLGMALVFLATTISSGSILLDHLPATETATTLLRRLMSGDLAGLWDIVLNLRPAEEAFFSQGVIVMLLAGVVIGIRCSGAITGERERQTWEALLLTPLETRELIRDKVWGIVGASYPYLAAYALPALALAALGGMGAACWTLLWLAVTWLALFYVGAAGLWCSVRSRGSWRSLLGTLALTYLGGFALYCVTSMLAGIVAMLLFLILFLLETLLGDSLAPRVVPRLSGITSNGYAVAFCITLAGIFILLAWTLLRSAEYRVSILERTKHWKNEPRRPGRLVRRARS